MALNSLDDPDKCDLCKHTRCVVCKIEPRQQEKTEFWLNRTPRHDMKADEKKAKAAEEQKRKEAAELKKGKPVEGKKLGRADEKKDQ